MALGMCSSSFDGVQGFCLVSGDARPVFPEGQALATAAVEISPELKPGLANRLSPATARWQVQKLGIYPSDGC